MTTLTTTGKPRWPIDIHAEPAFYSHLDGPYKGAARSAPLTVLGSAVAAAVLISAQGAFAAEPGQIQTKAGGTSQEEIALPAITVTGPMDTATTEGTGSY
ncbi:MAG: TonB-dependent siderophore receptor, partial [Caldilinea sp.]